MMCSSVVLTLPLHCQPVRGAHPFLECKSSIKFILCIRLSLFIHAFSNLSLIYCYCVYIYIINILIVILYILRPGTPRLLSRRIAVLRIAQPLAWQGHVHFGDCAPANLGKVKNCKLLADLGKVTVKPPKIRSARKDEPLFFVIILKAGWVLYYAAPPPSETKGVSPPPPLLTPLRSYFTMKIEQTLQITFTQNAK